MATSPSNPPLVCPNCTVATVTNPIAVTCPNDTCFLSIAYRKRSFIAVLIAILVALVLFRVGDSIWPLYLLVALGTVHLYAVIFSRGQALGSAAVLFVAVAVAWGVWESGTWLADQGTTAEWELTIRFRTFQAWAAPKLPYLALPLWLLGAFWSLLLGRQGAASVRFTGGYLLAMMAFVFGLWGVFAVMIEARLIDEAPFRWVVGITLVMPLLLLLVLLQSQPPPGQGPFLVALVALILTSYLGAVQFLTDVVNRGLGTFLPRLLGRPPLRSVELGWLSDVLHWRALIATVLFALGVVSLLVLSGAEALARFRATNPTWNVAGRAGISGAANGVGQLITPFAVAVLNMALVVYKVILLVGLTLVRLAVNLWRTLWASLRYVLYIVVPVLLFSLLSVMIIFVLRAYAVYKTASSAADPRVLWGEAMAVIVCILALSAVAILFTPAGQQYHGAALEGSVVLGLLLYAFVSIAAVVLPVLWWGFQWSGVDFPGAKPGQLYLINTVALLALGSIVIIAWLVPGLKNHAGILTVILAAGFGTVAVIVGLRPIIAGLRKAAGE